MGVERDSAKDYLYYPADWMWPRSRDDAIKSLLLFFDGVAISLPDDLAAAEIDRSPGLAQPLKDKGLLINLDPEQYVSSDAAARLAGALTQWLRDRPELRSQAIIGRTLTHHHWGWREGERIQEAEAFTEELRSRGLAAATGNLWRLHPTLRLLVLLAYCRVLHGEMQQKSDMTLQPLLAGTDDMAPHPADALRAIAGPAQAQQAWRRGQSSLRVIESDWQEVGVDLGHVPLDEVLDFRDQHGASFRAYVRGLRELIVAAEQLSGDQFEAELRTRVGQMADEAASLRTATRRAFGRTAAGMLFAIAGATWTAAHGDLLGALLATAGAASAVTGPERPVTVYSYLFDVRGAFEGRS